MTQSAYRSDLIAAQWQLLEAHIPPAKPGGRRQTLNMRAVCNAIFYLLHNGKQWHDLSHDFPLRLSIYSYFKL